jgi:hypothetical protein
MKHCGLAFALLMAVFAFTVACTQSVAPAPAAPLTEALLELARSWSSTLNASDFARSELDRIAARVEAAHAADPALDLRESLRKVIFEELGFTREVDDNSLRYVFLPSVLQARRGSCVGLGTLYLALGERLGLDMHALMVPGHFYIQLRENGQLHNTELLRQGEELPDAWYRERWPILAPSSIYARPLTQPEVEAVVLFDIGNDQQRKHALARAERAYHQAGERFPDFAEAHASEGSVAHLLGAFDRARVAYAQASAANAKLPGLQQNIALLQTELAADSGRP